MTKVDAQKWRNKQCVNSGETQILIIIYYLYTHLFHFVCAVLWPNGDCCNWILFMNFISAEYTISRMLSEMGDGFDLYECECFWEVKSN